MSKMTPQEYKNYIIKSIGGPLSRPLIWLGITHLKISDSNAWKNNNDYNYQLREINPYNPLSYIILSVAIPIFLIIEGINKETFVEIKKLFKYH